MATTDRQNRLLVAEDWRKIYTAFQQADFKSYDFETIREPWWLISERTIQMILMIT
jgi:hypothetical protein